MASAICDLICENQPLPANSSIEKNSSKVCVVTYLIDYSSYFHQIFSFVSAGHDLHETMSVGTCMAANLHSFCTNPEIPSEKCAKSGRVGGQFGYLALRVFQENAGS